MAATVSTHVLDIARCTPAAGISVGLFALDDERRPPNVGRHQSRRSHRSAVATDVPPGVYELVFAVTDYFELGAIETFFDEIPVRFRIDDSAAR